MMYYRLEKKNMLLQLGFVKGIINLSHGENVLCICLKCLILMKLKLCNRYTYLMTISFSEYNSL